MLTEGAAPEKKSEVRTRCFYYKVIQASEGPFGHSVWQVWAVK